MKKCLPKLKSSLIDKMVKTFIGKNDSPTKFLSKVCAFMVPAVVLLIVTTIPLFLSIAKDSGANRDAVNKVTSPETETWLIIVLIMTVAVIVYMSVTGILLARKRRLCTNWVYYAGDLYALFTVAPRRTRGTTPVGNMIIFYGQKKFHDILTDTYTLRQIISGEKQVSNIYVHKADRITELVIDRKKATMKLCDGKIPAFAYPDMNDYDTLIELIKQRAV